MTQAQRFWSKVTKTETCWLWTGATIRNGYGNFWLGGSKGAGAFVVAHRFAYEALVGPIPEGLTLDHVKDLCPNRNCVNPAHLEPVTGAENTRRRADITRTHCPQCGSEMTDANTYTKPGTRKRECRVCRKRNRKK